MNSQSEINSFGIMVADHVSAMLAYWDKDLICRFANEAFRDWFGKTREEMVGKMSAKEVLGPKLYEQNLPYILAALNGEKQTFEREIMLHTGNIRPSIVTYYPDIVGNEVKGFFVHVADISPVKLIEIELAKTNEIIKEQNKRLLNYSNIISHNLKNYDLNFSGVLNLIEEADSEDIRIELLQKLRIVSNGFSETLTHLNEISYAENMSGLKPEQINLFDYACKTINALTLQINSCQAIILNNINSEITLSANPAYIESVFTNLLTNAIKYRHPDRYPKIELNCFTTDNETVLSIADNGRGIDLDKYGNDLFGMYKTFHGNSDAHGIGLFITKYQLESMGAIIKVESKENVGTSFTIYFKRNS